MIAAISIHTIYSLADGIWVSGLGSDALAAIGFVFPFFFLAMAIATGLGVGGGSAISRRIGAQDKAGADNVGTHVLVMMLILALSFTVPFFVFAEGIFNSIGAGGTAELATVYARIIAAGTVVIFFSFVANAILHSEGDAKRAMFAIVLGAGINIVLDPIFIYTLGLGVAGAAWATLTAMSISSALLFNWLFLRKDTYLSFSFQGFRFNKSIIKDIFRVGLPASVQQLSMSIMMLIMNIIIVQVGGTDGVAVFSAGWRVSTMAITPLLGISTAVVSVTGATFGAQAYEKLDAGYIYALKIGVIVEAIIAIFVFFSAPFITAAFTHTENSAELTSDIITFLRIVCILYPAVGFGMLSSSMFQGAGKGVYSLVLTVFRTIVLTAPLAWLFSVTLNLGLLGTWIGLVTASAIGSAIAFTWAKIYINNLLTPQKMEQ
jgi:putative MATE family efflux protein